MRWYGEEFGEEGDRLAVGTLGVLQAVMERGESRNTRRSCGRLGFVGFGRRMRMERSHEATILHQPE